MAHFEPFAKSDVKLSQLISPAELRRLSEKLFGGKAFFLSADGDPIRFDGALPIARELRTATARAIWRSHPSPAWCSEGNTALFFAPLKFRGKVAAWICAAIARSEMAEFAAKTEAIEPHIPQCPGAKGQKT